MKKITRIATILMLTLVCCIGFASCGHKHTFVAEWSNDGENHWHVCTGKDCDEVKDKAAHVYDNACDTDCNVCGATRTVGEHVYDGEADATCNICGEERALPTRYKANDEAEWNAAVNFKEMTRFTMKATVDGAYGEIVRDGDVIWVTEYEDGASGRKKLGEEFYVKDGEAYYIVEWIKDSVYERESCTASEYENMLDIVASFAVGELSYADFTYNEETHRYVGKMNVHTLTFVGGVIAKIESENASATTTITFEENTVTVPENHVFKIDAARYENAMNFKDEDGKSYQNVDYIALTHAEVMTTQYKVTKDAAYRYSTASDLENLETIWTNEDGKGVVYTKKTKDSEWIRTVQTEKFDDFASFVLPGSDLKNVLTKIAFEALTYNEDDQTYSGSYKLGSYTMNVTLSFEDGKLVKYINSAVKNDVGSSILGGNRTITYGNAEIEIPTSAKTVYDVAYDEDNNAYTLENISFSAGETKWFAFEVTKTIYDENKGTSGSYDVIGAFTIDGSAVLTIEVENASGGKIENTGATNGAIYLEDLSAAGTYYVKITASEACNGKLSISFA